jgi:hypothetical protein
MPPLMSHAMNGGCVLPLNGLNAVRGRRLHRLPGLLGAGPVVGDHSKAPLRQDHCDGRTIARLAPVVTATDPSAFPRSTSWPGGLPICSCPTMARRRDDLEVIQRRKFLLGRYSRDPALERVSSSLTGSCTVAKVLTGVTPVENQLGSNYPGPRRRPRDPPMRRNCPAGSQPRLPGNGQILWQAPGRR